MSAGALIAVALIVSFSAVVQLAAGFGFGLASVPLLAIPAGLMLLPVLTTTAVARHADHHLPGAAGTGTPCGPLVVAGATASSG